MTAEVKKFTFDKTFDSDFAEEIIEEELEPINPPRLYTEEEFETAILQAKKDAKSQAEIEMRESLENHTNELAVLMNTQIEALCQTCQESYKNHFTYNAELACAILKKIFPILFKDYNQVELKAIIDENMPSLKSANEIQIHHPSTFSDSLKNTLSSSFKKQNKSDVLSFVEEADYSEFQISIQWENSGIERNSEDILNTIINHYHSNA